VRRVVITGLGVVSALGTGRKAHSADLWGSHLEGRGRQLDGREGACRQASSVEDVVAPAVLLEVEEHRPRRPGAVLDIGPAELLQHVPPERPVAVDALGDGWVRPLPPQCVEQE